MQIPLTKTDINVPTEDAATDVTIRDVIGKKSDTTSGTSIVAISKQVKAKTDTIPANPLGSADIAVPTEDSDADVTIRDVVGKKSDTVAGDSVIALLKQIQEQLDTIEGKIELPD